MKNKNGFSLVEILISMIVASILILTVGVLSSTANRSLNKLNSQQAIYNDISYGFKLMQNRARAAAAFSKVVKPAGWRSDQFVVGSSAFGIYRNSRNGIFYRDFVFTPDGIIQELILSVPDPNDSDNNLLMTIPGCDCTRNGSATYNCTTLPATTACTGSPKSAVLVLTGNKDKIKFDLETTILRRN